MRRRRRRRRRRRVSNLKSLRHNYRVHISGADLAAEGGHRPITAYICTHSRSRPISTMYVLLPKHALSSVHHGATNVHYAVANPHLSIPYIRTRTTTPPPPPKEKKHNKIKYNKTPPSTRSSRRHVTSCRFPQQSKTRTQPALSLQKKKKKKQEKKRNEKK